MQLILARHGIAQDKADAGKPDAERSLTPEGIEKTNEAAAGLRAAGIQPGLMATSPLLRARQTAEIVHRHIGDAAPVEIWPQLEHADHSALLDRLRNIEPRYHDGHVILVGHEPGLSRFASRLLTGKADALQIDFKKAAALAMEMAFEEDGKPFATLLWFAPPRHLRLMKQS